MQQIGTKVLETKRLVLRPFSMDDAEAMYKNWASDDEVTKYLMWPSHKDVTVSENVLKEWISNYKDNSYYQWAIVLKEYSDQPIGCIGVINRIDDTLQMAHIGYCIGRNWWHQGITSEALQVVMTFLFDEVGVNRIESRHDPKNPNSGEVMKKCGMHYEGTLKQGDWNNQGVCDTSYYALLASERVVYEGVLIKESINDESIIDLLNIHKVELWNTGGKPKYWTVLFFTSNKIDFPELISKVMISDPENGGNWFVDFKAGNDKYIVFKDKVLKYQIGNQEEKDNICNECRKMGILDRQMDWSE